MRKIAVNISLSCDHTHIKNTPTHPLTLAVNILYDGNKTEKPCILHTQLLSIAPHTFSLARILHLWSSRYIS
jgi:hypothetical protein